MPRAVVDPEELRRFAQSLKHFSGELSQEMSGLQGRFSALSDTWRDQEHEKFAREFTQTMQVLARFVEVANEHVPFLMRKAERIEEYLHQR
jgi:WXG100 family type VII secretion target